MTKISKIFENLRKLIFISKLFIECLSDEDLLREEREMLVLLYEFPAETRLTVYRRLDIFFLLEE